MSGYPPTDWLKQDKKLAQKPEQTGPKGTSGGAGKGQSPNPRRDLDKLKKDQDEIKTQLGGALKPNPGDVSIASKRRNTDALEKLRDEYDQNRRRGETSP